MRLRALAHHSCTSSGASTPPPTLIVDGMNVIGSRPDGWWRDRDGAVRRLTGRLQELAETSAEAITVVFDGRPLPDLPEGEHGGVVVRYARRRGPDAADDRIVELVGGGEVRNALVITSDRELRERVARHGCETQGAIWLLERLDTIDGPEDLDS